MFKAAKWFFSLTDVCHTLIAVLMIFGAFMLSYGFAGASITTYAVMGVLLGVGSVAFALAIGWHMPEPKAKSSAKQTIAVSVITTRDGKTHTVKKRKAA